jgi:hypothetical protein
MTEASRIKLLLTPCLVLVEQRTGIGNEYLPTKRQPPWLLVIP